MADKDRPAKRRKPSKNDPYILWNGDRFWDSRAFVLPQKKESQRKEPPSEGPSSVNGFSAPSSANGFKVKRKADGDERSPVNGFSALSSANGFKVARKADRSERSPLNGFSRAKKEDDDEREAVKDEPQAKSKKNKMPSREGSRDSPMLAARMALPIWAHQDEIKDSLKKNDFLLIVGETGSGKSTQTPQFLFDEPWCRRKKVRVGSDVVGVGGMIAITQPRRVAATSLAGRVAKEMGTPLGAGRREGLVGYSVRFDHNVPKGTKVKFLTEGMLLQEHLRDPQLRQYSAVIVDEIHERSIDVDLLTGFLKQILTGDKAGRGGIPLKVVVMSATADVEQIQDFFKPADAESDMQLLRIKGRQFPVDIKYTDQDVPDIIDALVKKVFEIHLQEPFPGDILAFLDGQERIEAAQERIEEHCATLASGVPKLQVCPLYGQLPLEAQQAALQPVKTRFTRKVVLATNIAETSLTVPGVSYVIDSGWAKVKQFRPRLGMESLLSKAISKSSAIQRTGRAGREGPGKCYRLYNEGNYDGLREADLPEILRNDPLGAVLTMKARGIKDIFAFPLMDFPTVEATQNAHTQLRILGALTSEDDISDVGRKLARFPVPATYGRVLLAAAEPASDCLLEAIDVIACVLSGEEIFQTVLPEDEAHDEVEEARAELYRREGDLLTYLTTMQRYTAEHADRTAWCRRRRVVARGMREALKVRRQLRGLCLAEGLLPQPGPPPDPQPFEPLSPERAGQLLRCFLAGFGTRTALLAPDRAYYTSVGSHQVAIHPGSVLRGQKHEAIMFLENVWTKKNYAKKVSVVRGDWVVESIPGDD
ncbi:helicase associated domain-containing protein [Xylariaceae sp. FL0804]|nr:helicase associated domain-containing protein [Xylariaceae sp. FL0804]